MLVLARQVSEFVTVTVPACPGGCCPARTIRVGINAAHGNTVRLAFDAPRDVTILRDELLPSPAPLVPPGCSPPALKPGVRR